jgi:signal transduction histidine kinase
VNDHGDDAQPDLPGRERRRLQTSRLVQYLLLQALIVAACIFALRQSLPEPPAEYQVTAFRLSESGTERAVTLPYFSPLRHAMNDPPRFAGQFIRPAGEAARAWSVFLPRFTNGVEVTINGVVILDSRRDPAANRPDRNTAQIAVIPASVLHDGANDVSIKLFIWGPISGFLDRIWVGPDELLRPSYNLRTLIFVTLPVVFSSWQAILAVILGIMWVMRRHEPAYGVLAAAMAVGVGQAFLQTPMGETPFSRLNVILISSAPIESGLVLTFALLFAGWKWQRYGWIIFIPGVLLALAGLFGNQAMVRALFLYLAVPMVGVSLLIMAVVTAHSMLKRRNVASLLLGCAVTIMLTCWIVDLLSVFGVMPNRIFTARLSYSALLVAIGAGLTWRFARALNEVDGFAGRLVTQVREAEEKLKASFAREEERARAAALARERTRLMRDLHDGLGGQLVSIVALSERGNGSAGIGDAARAALKDLRLVIDSMDDIGGDLMLALGSWRERATAQLRPHDIALDWRAVTAQGLPVHPELRPWHVIQIVRLLDEAVTNAVKHANARRITVRIETLAGADGLDRGCITVEDDGKGFEIAADGAAAGAIKAARGWRKMRSRAARCGAELELSSCAQRTDQGTDQGTRVRLTLPHRFPDSDGAAG